METEKTNEQTEQPEEEFGNDKPILEEETPEVDSQTASAVLDSLSDEPEEKPEDQVPLSKYMGEKNRARDAELDNARLQGRLDEVEASRTQTAAVQEKSPLELAMEEQGVTAKADLDLTTGETIEIMERQQAWKDRKAQNEVAQDTAAQLLTTQQENGKAEYSVERGEGLDIDTVVGIGENLLTNGEKLDIGQSPDRVKLAYNLCLKAIIARGDDKTKETFQKRLDARKPEPAKDDKDPPKKDPDPDPDETTGDEEIANPRLRGLVAGLGMFK